MFSKIRRHFIFKPGAQLHVLGKSKMLGLPHVSSLGMLPLPPPPQRNTTVTTPTHQIVQSKPGSYSQTPGSSSPAAYIIERRQHPIVLRQPRRTHPLIWCIAVWCLLFSLFIIFFGVATLITYLVFKPRYPLFDIPNAGLNAIYFDSPEYFNGNLKFLANFTNPNKRIGLRFEYLDLQLFFFNQLIAVQTINPFSQRQGETSVGSIDMVSSLVHLPSNLANELQEEVESNRVVYIVEGRFKVRAMMGFVHFGYWLKARCILEMTGPPNGLLVARRCKTKR